MFQECEFLIAIFPITTLFNLHRGLKCPGGVCRNCACALADEAWSRVTHLDVPPVRRQPPRAVNWPWARSCPAGRRGQAMSHWSCPAQKRCGTTEVTKILRWEVLLFFLAVQLLSSKWSMEEMITFFPKTRQGRLGKEVLIDPLSWA